MTSSNDGKWLYCPKCKNKTKTKVYEHTIMKNFPLFCPWCKAESIVNVEKGIVVVVDKNLK